MSGSNSGPRPRKNPGWSGLVGQAIQKAKEMIMSLVDGEGKPIPPGSWGGDLDPAQATRCRECGVPILFGNFCPQHFNEAREKNEEFMAQRRKELGIDPDVPVDPDLVKSAPAAEREIDMDALAAKERARAQAIMTPGQEIPKPVDHMAAPPEPAKPPQQAAPPASNSLILPASAQERSVLKRRSDDFLIGQAVGWIGELRTMAEEGKVPAHLAGELLQLTAELTYALAGLLK